MVKRFITTIFSKIQTAVDKSVSSNLNNFSDEYGDSLDSLIRVNQNLLISHMLNDEYNIHHVSMSIFSESDEDGLLLYIFSKIGFKNKICIDIGGGTGLRGSNTANLFLNFGFTGLVFEGEKTNAEVLQEIYNSKKATRHFPPKIICEYVTAENINYLIEAGGIRGKIDLLSIDIDSIDYWIWDAITVIDPNVVIVEVQCILGENESKTVPPNFKGTIFETIDNKSYGIYNSASLTAFNNLGIKKGYSLVATSQLGFNAIFIKDEFINEKLPVISVKEGLDKPFVKWAQKTFRKRAEEFEWIEV
jgi:hypothetical protein